MADYQEKLERVRNQNAEVVALSVDSEADARSTVETFDLTFPVAYGLDAFEMRDTIGCYINQDPPHMHATGFVLTPDGTIAQAVYSSGPVGRLTAGHAAALIEFLQKSES